MSEHNSRQRLRPWLIGQLDNGVIPGLIWLPNESGKIDKVKFRIPWKHGGKHDWTPDQSRVFKEWAVHTGKFREGVDEETFAKWKTNLRCALNKASDIQEIQEESQKEAENPFKVYKFLPRKDKASHPIHKKTYTDMTCLPTNDVSSGLPAHIASYSSSGSSLSSRSMLSGSSRVTSMEMGGAQFAVDMPSDLEGLSSNSLRDVVGDMSSLETNKLKEEAMDFDDNSQSSDGMLPAHLPGPPYQGQPVFSEPCRIKTEGIDQTFQGNQVLIQQQQADLFPDHLINMVESQRSPFVVDTTSPQSVTRASESSGDNSQHGFMNTAPSPSFSNASSPYNVASPSPTQFVNTTTCSPPQPYPNVSPAPSPQNAFAAVSQAASPQQPFTTPALSPQGAQFGLGASVVPITDRSDGAAKEDCVPGFVNQMAGLDMKDMSRTLMHQYPIQTTKCYSDVDIGHPCVNSPDQCAMMVSVLYKNKEIISQHVTEPAGCIIAYNPITQQQGQILDEVGLNVIKEKVYDQKPGRVEIALPEWEKTGNVKLDREVDNLLKNAGRGIVIECKKGDIYAKRLCKTSVYYATYFGNEKYEKINRHEDAQEQVKIFDFHNIFEPAIDHFGVEARTSGQKHELKHPNPEVFLFVGQNGTPSNAHTRYVVIKITSCKASQVLKSMEKDLFSLTAEVSNSDSLDKIHHALRNEFDNHGT